MKKLHDPEYAKASFTLVNYKNIELNTKECSVFLKRKALRIGVGGKGRGFAAERAKIILKEAEIASKIVNAAGDLTAYVNQLNGLPFVPLLLFV